MGVCYVIGAGDFGTGHIVKEKDDYIIAGDGGYHACKERGIVPDLVVGDFDSLGYLPDHPNVKRHRPEKDDTDMGLAVREGLRLGYRDFCIFGGTGGRLSHTVANIQLLADLAGKGISAVLMGEKSTIRVICNKVISLKRNQNRYLSIFAYGSKAEGVDLDGVKYPLSHAVLSNDYPLGVSNEFTEEEAKIGVMHGLLLIITEE